MKICGECLHDQETHTHDGHGFMYCAICIKVCEPEEFSKERKSSKIIIHDGIPIDLNQK